MLGPNKWRFLAIIAGLLLANAIDTPAKTGTVQISSFIRKPNSEITAALHGFNTATATTSVASSASLKSKWNTRISRNLYPPHQTFSNIDDVQVLQKQRQADGSITNKFGAFRIGRSTINRRSDENTFIINNPNDENININNNFTTGTTSEVTIIPHKRNYVYIPLIQDVYSHKIRPNITLSNIKPPTNIQFTGEGIANDRTSQARSTEIIDDEIAGRRLGIKFPSHSLKYENPFQPQEYREDNLHFAENLGFQRPYSEELSTSSSSSQSYSSEYDNRFTRQISFDSDVQSIPSSQHPIEFPGPNTNTIPRQTSSPTTKSSTIFTDEVTKFGDINGPVTAVQRPQRGIFFSEDFRNPRPFIPPKVFIDYSDYPGPPKSRFYPFKSRTPRVVFPANDNFPSGPSSGGYVSDSVAFR